LEKLSNILTSQNDDDKKKEDKEYRGFEIVNMENSPTFERVA